MEGAWRSAAREVSLELGVDIHVVTIGLRQEIDDPLGDWVALREVPDHGCVLVRPDRFVGWRSWGETGAHVDSLRNAMSKILGQASLAKPSNPPQEALLSGQAA